MIAVIAMRITTGLSLWQLTQRFERIPGKPPRSTFYRMQHGALPYSDKLLCKVERDYPGSTRWFAHPLWDALRLLEVSHRSPLDRTWRDISSLASERLIFDVTPRTSHPILDEAENAAEAFIQRLPRSPTQLRRQVNDSRSRPFLIASAALVNCDLMSHAGGLMKTIICEAIAMRIGKKLHDMPIWCDMGAYRGPYLASRTGGTGTLPL